MRRGQHPLALDPVTRPDPALTIHEPDHRYGPVTVDRPCSRSLLAVTGAVDLHRLDRLPGLGVMDHRRQL